MTDKPTKFVLGVDLDGVVADFNEGLRKVAAEWTGKPLRKLPTRVSYGFPEWGLSEFGDYKDLHRFAVTQRQLFQILKPIAGAPQALRKFSAKNIHIRIITHRLFIQWFHPQAIQQTVVWLQAQGIPFWDLCFMGDKSAVDADLYLEDNAEHIKTLQTMKKKVIIFSNSTNERVPGPRVQNWDHAERLVFKEFNSWSRKKR